MRSRLSGRALVYAWAISRSLRLEDYTEDRGRPVAIYFHSMSTSPLRDVDGKHSSRSPRPSADMPATVDAHCRALPRSATLCHDAPETVAARLERCRQPVSSAVAPPHWLPPRQTAPLPTWPMLRFNAVYLRQSTVGLSQSACCLSTSLRPALLSGLAAPRSSRRDSPHQHSPRPKLDCARRCQTVLAAASRFTLQITMLATGQ
jgi:hypothetical protein